MGFLLTYPPLIRYPPSIKALFQASIRGCVPELIEQRMLICEEE